MSNVLPDEGLWEKGLTLLESQLGPVQTLQFIAMVSHQPFDYQQWRQEQFGKLSADEVIARLKSHQE